MTPDASRSIVGTRPADSDAVENRSSEQWTASGGGHATWQTPGVVWIVVAVIVFVVAVLLGTAYAVRSRSRGGGDRPRRASAVTGPADAPSAAKTSAETAPEATHAVETEAVRNANVAAQSVSRQAPDETAARPGVIETPLGIGGRLPRLRERLARSESALGRGLLALLSRDRLDDATWQDVEDLLLTADVGLPATSDLVSSLRTQAKVLGTRTADDVRALLRNALLDVVDGGLDRSLRVDRGPQGPAVVLVVGVNGTGKTTTVGKLARLLVAQGKTVVLGAADTFRAAAADQLETWGRRVGVPTVRGAEGADPASVAFEAVRAGIEQEVDVVLLDTAGRLHTKTGLMDELGKIKRVVEKRCPVSETLLVLDATIGQNGFVQAKVFAEVVDVSGVVLTKLDGTAKGGIVISVQRELGVPVKLVGIGEGPDDLAPFDPAAFVDALIGA